MGKYDPLRDFLRRQSAPVVVLTLAEIDGIVSLPVSARTYEWWWANEDVEATTHVQCKAWQAAGYEAQPDLRAGRIIFRRKAGRS